MCVLLFVLFLDNKKLKEIFIMDDNYRVKLEKFVEQKKYLGIQEFKNITIFIGRNGASDELLDILLEYLKIYPQQMSLISKSNLILLIFFTLL